MTNTCKRIIKMFALAIIAICGSLYSVPSEAAGEDVNYDGLYNDRQIVPNTMAIICKTDADDMVADVTRAYNCVNKIVTKLNNSDASVKKEGQDDLARIKYEELNNILGMAITKSATISNYEEVQNSMMEASAQTQTEHDDNASIANTTAVLTDVINSMRDLYAEKLKYQALAGITSIDPGVIQDFETEGSEGDNGEDNNSGNSGEGDTTPGASVEGSSTTTTATKEVPFQGYLKWVSDNQCVELVCTGTDELSKTCQENYQICPDGRYLDPHNPNIVIACESGSCTEIDLNQISSTSNQNIEYSSGNYCKSGDSLIKCPDGFYKQGLNCYECMGGYCALSICPEGLREAEQSTKNDMEGKGYLGSNVSTDKVLGAVDYTTRLVGGENADTVNSIFSGIINNTDRKFSNPDSSSLGRTPTYSGRTKEERDAANKRSSDDANSRNSSSSGDSRTSEDGNDDVAASVELPEVVITPDNRKPDDDIAASVELPEVVITPDNRKPYDDIVASVELPEVVITPDNRKPDDDIAASVELPEVVITPDNKKTDDDVAASVKLPEVVITPNGGWSL